MNRAALPTNKRDDQRLTRLKTRTTTSLSSASGSSKWIRILRFLFLVCQSTDQRNGALAEFHGNSDPKHLAWKMLNKRSPATVFNRYFIHANLSKALSFFSHALIQGFVVPAFFIHPRRMELLQKPPFAGVSFLTCLNRRLRR